MPMVDKLLICLSIVFTCEITQYTFFNKTQNMKAKTYWLTYIKLFYTELITALPLPDGGGLSPESAPPPSHMTVFIILFLAHKCAASAWLRRPLTWVCSASVSHDCFYHSILAHNRAASAWLRRPLTWVSAPPPSHMTFYHSILAHNRAASAWLRRPLTWVSAPPPSHMTVFIILFWAHNRTASAWLRRPLTWVSAPPPSHMTVFIILY